MWQEQVRGGYPEWELLGLSGLELMQSFLKRGGPPPPISHLMGMVPVVMEHGDVTFTMPATRWLLNPTGFIQGGVLATLADGPLGCAVHTALPPATPYTTSELSMTFIRPVTENSGLLTARGRLIHAGKSMALSEVAVTDGDDRLVAHGTSRCFVFAPLSPAPEPPDSIPPYEPPVYDTPDPYLRPVEGDTLPPAIWKERDGLDVLRACIERELPAPPIYYLTGMRPVEAGEGTATFVMPASEWLNSPLARVQGGAIAWLADSALSCAVQTIVPAGTAYVTLDLKVNFLRPVQADGKDLTARGTVVHRGRTLAIANAEVANAEGKKVAFGTGTIMLRPA
ncbi:MAG TPA: PaaI family thioesterase [Actinomycetota bacterium]|nr:PaaI family thioesterase [Actinomycetota bacterium]